MFGEVSSLRERVKRLEELLEKETVTSISYGSSYLAQRHREPTIKGQVDAILNHLDITVRAEPERFVPPKLVVYPKSNVRVGRPKGSKNYKKKGE